MFVIINMQQQQVKKQLQIQIQFQPPLTSRATPPPAYLQHLSHAH